METELDSNSGLRLEDQLCHALHHAARRISNVYMETLKGAGLTYPQYLVILILLEDDQLSVSEICVRLGLDSGTVTPLLKRMEANGHLSRSRSSDDERVVLAQLTDEGRALRDVASRARAEVVRRLDMSDQEILGLRGQLIEIADRLEA